MSDESTWSEVEDALFKLKEECLAIFEHASTPAAMAHLDRELRYITYVRSCLEIAGKIWWPALPALPIEQELSESEDEEEEEEKIEMI